MTDRVNELVAKSEAVRQSVVSRGRRPRRAQNDVVMDAESDSDLASSDSEDDDNMEGSPAAERVRAVITVPDELPSVNGPSTYFVVDSFNIHRLVISGVTCSSKFFSDVFYTNSRYAKVCPPPLSLPLASFLYFVIVRRSEKK